MVSSLLIEGTYLTQIHFLIMNPVQLNAELISKNPGPKVNTLLEKCPNFAPFLKLNIPKNSADTLPGPLSNDHKIHAIPKKWSKFMTRKVP